MYVVNQCLTMLGIHTRTFMLSKWIQIVMQDFICEEVVPEIIVHNEIKLRTTSTWLLPLSIFEFLFKLKQLFPNRL